MTLDPDRIMEVENPTGPTRRWVCDFDYVPPVGFPRCWIVELLPDGRTLIEELQDGMVVWK